MPAYVLLSPEPGAGKTTVAAALARKLGGATLTRLGDDANASADTVTFSKLSGQSATSVSEALAGDPSASPESRAIVVAAASSDADLTSFCSSVGSRLAGVVLNRVPTTRRERILADVTAKGLDVLFDLPEDRLLATPSLGDVAAALNAQTMYLDGNGSRPLGRAVIASISADPGQGYFLHRDANSVIVRSDKPDLQLAALNAGAACLIVTGDLPILGYVLERAEADEIPIIRTSMETVDAVKGIEGLYGSGPFSGSTEKLSRLAELTRDFDATRLAAA